MADPYSNQEEKAKLRRPAGRAEMWVRRLNDAYERLDIAARKLAHDEGIGILEGRGVGQWKRKDNRTYLDLNDGLPAFEDVVNSSLPAIPTPDVEAELTGDVIVERLCEALLEQTYRLADVEETTRECLWDNCAWGEAIAKAGWFMQKRHATVQYDDIDQESQVAEAHRELVEGFQIAEGQNHAIHVEVHLADVERIAEVDPQDPILEQLFAHVHEGHMSRMAETVLEHPEMSRVDPGKFLYDPFAEKWADRQWEAELCTERIEAIRGWRGARNITRENLPANETSELRDTPMDNLDYMQARADVWKIHDRLNDTYLIIPARGDDGSWEEDILPILESQWPYPCDIYESLVMRKTEGGKVRGLPTLELAIPILTELARVNRTMRRHVEKHSQYRRGFPRGTIDAKGKAQLGDSEKDIFEYPMSAGPGVEIKPPPIPDTLLQRRDQLMQDLRRLLGSDIITQGGDTPHQISATEAAARSGYHDTRSTRAQTKVDRFLSELSYKFLALYKKFYDPEEAIPLPIPTPAGVVYIALLPKQIPDRLKIVLDVSSTTVGAKQQRAIERQNYFTSLMQSGLGDIRSIFEDWGRLIDIHEPSRLFADPSVVQARLAGAGQEGQPGAGPAGPGTPSLPAPKSSGTPAQSGGSRLL